MCFIPRSSKCQWNKDWNSCPVLVAPHGLAGTVSEVEKLNIHLDVMARHLLLMPLPELCPVLPRVARQAVQAIALEHVVDRLRGDFDAMIPEQIPVDGALAEVVGAAQVEDLLLDGGGVRRFGFCGHGLELMSAASPSFS